MMDLTGELPLSDWENTFEWVLFGRELWLHWMRWVSTHLDFAMAFKMDDAAGSWLAARRWPLIHDEDRHAMGFLLDEMKMDLLLDLMGPDLDSVLSAGENANADRCHLECLLDLSCSIWVPVGI
ncbi:hypothetical protein ACLOJK_024256 [Asimina triloba]